MVSTLRVLAIRKYLLRIADALLLSPLILGDYPLKQARGILQSATVQLFGGLIYSLYLWRQLFTGSWLHPIEPVYLPILVHAMFHFGITSSNLLEERFKAYLYSKIGLSITWAAVLIFVGNVLFLQQVLALYCGLGL